MKVYLVGPVTDDNDYFHKFAKAENYLSMDYGYTVLNPVKNLGFTYREYIDMGLCELMKCDAIYLLRGWENSKGALLEKHYAETVGLKIIYQSGEDMKGGAE